MLVRSVPALELTVGGRLPACLLSLPAPMVGLVAWLKMIREALARTRCVYLPSVTNMKLRVTKLLVHTYVVCATGGGWLDKMQSGGVFRVCEF